ncbi:glyoxalase [Sphingomonas sp. CGMCC 1.13654]|uniref:Glyoxalase n=1 Tax=Sphingomonas chungangi TaxID=2683589 RepID=A0A838L849_9SPHN|nr:VOC family protein [Sphingomonas chungangi]MBA2933718.1 glyoxalase [Sphingomonas chungangi]MVW55050.1 glyoxalase [Sphingomonas chungangi]
MTALQLDHVNIRTARLADCVHFYGSVLGLRVQPPPMADDTSNGAYVCDATGHPVVHLVGTDIVVDGNGTVRGAAQRGMIDHFALRCSGDPAPYAERLVAAGETFDRMDVTQIGMHLIFVRDPNGVMVELGFPLAD